VDSEDDQRRKGVEKYSKDVVTTDWESFKTKDVRDQPVMKRDEREERSFVQTGDIITTTETSSSESVHKKDVHERPGKEWTQRIQVEPDSAMRHDEWEEQSFTQTGVITTTETTSSTESVRKKNVHEEPGQQWSERIRDESDSAFRKYRPAGDDHGSMTEESWTLTSGRLTQHDTSSTLKVHEGPARALSPSSLQGGVRCQAVDSEQLSVCSHEEKRRFYISAVIDPRNGLRLSVREVTMI